MNKTNFFHQFDEKHSFYGNASKHKEAEAISTLLSSFGNDVYDCKESFIKEEIGYRDLASLNRSDLDKLGIKDSMKQDELLMTFHDLPGQDFSLQDILKSQESRDFNNQVIRRSAIQIEHLRKTILSANLKLKMAPSEDSIIDEKYFASKFVVDVLEELKLVTNEIEENLKILEKTAGNAEIKLKPKKRRIISLTITLLIGIGVTFFILRKKI